MGLNNVKEYQNTFGMMLGIMVIIQAIVFMVTFTLSLHPGRSFLLASVIAYSFGMYYIAVANKEAREKGYLKL